MKKYCMVICILFIILIYGCEKKDDRDKGNLANINIVNEQKVSISLNGIREINNNELYIASEREYCIRRRVNVVERFSGISLPDKMDLLIIERASYPMGTLYELKIDCDEDFPQRYELDSDLWEGSWDRLHLGFFLVIGDNVYRIRQTDSVEIETYNIQEIMIEGELICGNEPIEDHLNEYEAGFHKKIDVNGIQREYISYENYGNTNFFENITWEIGAGIVEYNCGYGALENLLSITVSENKGMAEEEIERKEEMYQRFLKNEQKAMFVNQTGDTTFVCLDNMLGFEDADIERNCIYQYRDYNNDELEDLVIMNNRNMKYIVVVYADDSLEIIECGSEMVSEGDYWNLNEIK